MSNYSAASNRVKQHDSIQCQEAHSLQTNVTKNMRVNITLGQDSICAMTRGDKAL